MLVSRYLLLCWCGALVVAERVVINRRARQRLPAREAAARSLSVVESPVNQLSISPSVSEPATTRARVPRRRSQSVRGGGSTGSRRTPEQVTASAPVSEPSLRSRSRARIPRRRVNPNRDLERNERNALAVSLETEVRTPARTRSRSRSRFRSVPSEVKGEVRGRTVSRPSDVTPRLRDNSERPGLTSPVSREPVKSSGPQVIFPRKNLFPKLKKKFFLEDNEVDTGSGRGTGPGYTPYKSVNKDRLRNSLYREEEAVREDLDYSLDYSYTDLQSGLTQPGLEPQDLITVTHQVPTRTIFTVVERGNTKSLFAEVLEASLEVVDVRKLRSTQINSSPILYSNVQTKYPSFGVTELEFDAILPSPHLSTTVQTVSLGGRVTELTRTLKTTVYSPSILTHRETQTQALQPGSQGPGVSVGTENISQIIQNVLLNLIGGGLLGGQPGRPETMSQLITHTRTFITTSTQTATALIPVNFRGSEIFQTVTDVEVVTSTSTDFSVQTLLNFVPASDKPFYPLAPTLNRAVRIVPENQYRARPPPILSTSLLTDTTTEVRTISTDITSSLTITLGGRQVVTDIIEPTTTVVTRTSLSTKTVLVEEPSRSSQSQNFVNKLKLVKSLLGLS